MKFQPQGSFENRLFYAGLYFIHPKGGPLQAKSS